MTKIRLLPIEPYNLTLLQQWRNSDEVMPNCRQHRPLTLYDMNEWYKTGDNKELFVMYLESTPIGVGGFVRIDWRNRKGEVSFYVAEKVSDEIIKDALTSVLYFGMATLNLWKAYFPCYAFNKRLPLYREVMVQEYIAQKEYYWKGKHWDRHILVKYNDK